MKNWTNNESLYVYQLGETSEFKPLLETK